MRNLILVHCKRFLFRWETFAVTLINLFLSICSTVFAVLIYEQNSLRHYDLIIYAITVISLFCTAAAVAVNEIKIRSTGAARNLLIAGHSKAQVFISKYIVAGVFGIIQGAVVIIPPLAAAKWMDDPVRFTVSMLLMYAAISCILMTVCLLSEHPTIFTVVTIVCLVFCSLGGKILAQLFAHPAYISSPAARIVTDQALRFDPIQPLSEYFEWYTVYSDDHQDTIEYLEGRIAELDDERLRAGMQASLEHYKLEYDSHMERIMLFPFYQSAFLLAVGIGGALIFRKQDLK